MVIVPWDLVIPKGLSGDKMKLGTLCYIKKNNKTLMMHRIKKPNDMHQGKWNALGGKLHPGETPEECVIREVKEESGLDIRQPMLKGLLTFPKFDKIDDWYVFVFTAADFTGTLIDCPEGRLEWIDDHKIQELNLWEGDHIFLKWVEGHRFFSGKLTYQDYKLAHHEVKFY